MKKRIISVLLTVSLCSLSLIGCGDRTADTGSGDGTDSPDTETDSTDEVEPEDILVVGPDDGVKLELWNFVEIHSQFYEKMLEQWNDLNPEEQIQITFTTYPYSDMHTKMIMAVQTGEGAPDICDIEIGQFPNFMQGDVQLRPLNDVIDPYRSDIVPARLELYSKDGEEYGIDFHVGATVMYYNVDILEDAGIDYTTIVTWDDFEAAGEILRDATDGAVSMTTVDTGGTDWLWVAMAEYGEDYTTDEGAPDIIQDSIIRMVEMQQSWLDSGIATVSPGGQLDTEEGFAAIADETVAAFPKAMWFMSRFLNYIPEMEGQWAIAPCPVFEEGQPRSVGIGGTGTVVSNQSDHADLAAEWLAFAKLSYEGNLQVWEILGFDTLNTSIWSDDEITNNTSNKYIKYFASNPFDTLNEIKDEIGMIKVGTINPAISEAFNLTILNNAFENGADILAELETAQAELDLESY